jgi:cell wall-associated NlpC family hydrolase
MGYLMKKNVGTFFIYIITFHLILLPSQKAVISVPIADLIGQQIVSLIPDVPAQQSYESIPVCTGEIKSSIACPRLHQLLYNDIVEIIKIVGDEACIRTTHGYYLIPSSQQPQSTYWTCKKNLTLFNDLIEHNISTTHIPPAADFSNPSTLACIDIVTLTEPHHDSTLRITFSAGTRFMKTPAPRKKRPTKLEVFAIDYEKMKLHKIKVPLAKIAMINCTKTQEDHITDFVTVLKKWAHPKNGHIPYVWGGTSFIKPIATHFKEITKTGHNGDYSFYEYEKDTQSPKNGFDCSGVILRATQICGIPYFCKNTTTIAQCLQPLQQENSLQAGDLILIKGHVMIVSDVKNNLLIEARSYGHGYGKLHEIPLNQVFDNIETYKDLCDVYYEKKAIKRKDKNGKIRDTFSNLQLFSMMSVFNKKDSQTT